MLNSQLKRDESTSYIFYLLRTLSIRFECSASCVRIIFHISIIELVFIDIFMRAKKQKTRRSVLHCMPVPNTHTHALNNVISNDVVFFDAIISN
jgi:hypothetical protein